MQLRFDSQFFMSMMLVGFVLLLFLLYNSLVEKPKRLRSKLSKQGISGPPPTFILGNIREIEKAKLNTAKSPSVEPLVLHDCASLIFPYLKLKTWSQKYGTLHSYKFLLSCISIWSWWKHGQKSCADIVFGFLLCSILFLR